MSAMIVLPFYGQDLCGADALADADTPLWLVLAALFVRGFGVSGETLPLMTVAVVAAALSVVLPGRQPKETTEAQRTPSQISSSQTRS